MRWDMDDLEHRSWSIPAAPDTSFNNPDYEPELHFNPLSAAARLLGDDNFDEQVDAVDVVATLLAAADALGKSRIINWDIQKAALAVEKSVGNLDLDECNILFVMSD